MWCWVMKPPLFLVCSFKISFNLLPMVKEVKDLTARLSNSMALCEESICLGNSLGPCSEEYGCTAPGLLEDAIRMERGCCRELLLLRTNSCPPPVCACYIQGVRFWGQNLTGRRMWAGLWGTQREQAEGFKDYRISRSTRFLRLGSLMIKAPPISV